jgi:FKBP12-rapamycin complex-associated protein
MPAQVATPALASGPSNLSLNSTAAWTESLAKIFTNLKSRDEAVRLAAAKDLGAHVSFYMSELNGDGVAAYNSELNRLIFGLTHSPHTNEKLGGITAIEVLIDLESEDNSARLYRFYQYLKPNLPCNDASVMIAASRALGKVCRHGAQSLGDQFMEFEVLRALDFLQSKWRTSLILFLSQFLNRCLPLRRREGPKRVRSVCRSAHHQGNGKECAASLSHIRQ